MKLLSIITVNLNNAIGLESTARSIGDQNFKNIEFIVVDGCSTDDSLKVLEKYDYLISRLIVEKDDGLYDAMNKGICNASGDFCLFLNSGDVFANDNSLTSIFSQINGMDILYFARARNLHQNHIIHYTPNYNINIHNYKKWLNNATPSHQATFFPKSFYINNKYDLNFKIASDIDYKQRAIKKYECIFIDEVIVNFELGGLSTAFNKLSQTNQIIREVLTISQKNGRYKSRTAIIFMFNQYVKYLSYKIFGDRIFFKIKGVLLRRNIK